MAVVPLKPQSRYKDTILYTLSNGKRVWGLFRLPGGLDPTQPTPGELQYRVKQQDIGFLDLIAYAHYGEAGERLWWVIAIYNGIRDPETDMQVGQVLRIPSYAFLSRFVSRGPIRQ